MDELDLDEASLKKYVSARAVLSKLSESSVRKFYFISEVRLLDENPNFIFTCEKKKFEWKNSSL